MIDTPETVSTLVIRSWLRSASAARSVAAPGYVGLLLPVEQDPALAQTVRGVRLDTDLRAPG